MADTADLLGGNQASRAITPARRVVAPTRRTTLPKPRLSTGLRVATAPVKVPKLTPPKLQSKKDDGGDKGVLGGLFSIPGSALKAIGSGIAGIPTLVGKGAQEIYGLGELTFDNILDAIDEDIFTSRLETDYQRGKEQGLQGDELYAYAMHRQHPFSGAIFSSMARTGGRVAELGTLGRFDYGEPGVDYATAFRKGDLGATLVEDIGNVILAGRMTGAGNVVARAGGALAETAPRLGKAVATTGRLIEEPVGETVRQAAGAAGRVAPRLRTATEGMKYAPGETTTQRFINRTEAIADAETPVRVLFQQIGDAYRAGQEARLGRLDVERAGLIDQRDAASAAGDNVRASQIQADIERLDATIGKRVEGKGLVKRGRQIARRTKLLGERAGQTVIQQFNRVRDYGVAPQTVEVYRAQASRLRQQADQVEGGAGPYPDYVAVMAGQESPQTVEAQRLRQQADSLDQLADLKEQYPEQMSGPVPAAVQEAAIHLASKVKALVALADQGLTIEDLVRAATDPSINPDLAKSGMQPTAEGVQLAIDVYRALRGEATNLNPAQVMQVTAIFNLLKEWSRTAQESMMRGEGVPEGPVPFTWFEIYPTPSYLAAELAKGGVENRLAEAVLDQAIADFVGAAIDAGVLPPEVLKEWKLNLENPNGNYRRLAKLDPTDAGYRIAFEISRLTFRQLKAQAPNLVMNPRIYPANMRPIIITQRQGARRVTGYDVETIALELARLEDEFDTLIDANILKGIGNDIRDALDPQKKITKTVYDRVLQRVETIRTQATERRLALESQAATLTAEQRAILDRLYEVEQALSDANTLLMSQAANPPAKSARLQKVEQRSQALYDERQALQTELASLDEQVRQARSAEVPDAPELRRFIDENKTLVDQATARANEIDTELAALEAQHKELLSEVEYFLSLTDEQLSNVLLDYDQLVASGFSEADLAPTGPRQPTPGELRGYKQRRIDELQKTEDNALDRAVNQLAPEGMPVGRSNAPRLGKVDDPKRFTIDGLEDYRLVVQRILGDKEMYQAFLDEMTVWDPENAPAGANTGRLTPDQMPEIYDASQRGAGGATAEGAMTPEAWLEEYARAFRDAFEARQQRAKVQRTSLKKLEQEFLQDAASQFSEAESAPYGESGLAASDIYRSYKYLDRDTLITARRNIKFMEGQLERLRAERETLRQDINRLRQESSDFNNRLRPPVPKETLLQSTRARARLRQIDRQLAQVPRSERAAVKAEPIEAQASEQARLRGTGSEVRRPTAGAEGPALGRVRVPRQRAAEAEVARLNKADANRTTRLARTRRAIAEQEAVAGAAKAVQDIPLQRPEFTAPSALIGPELFAEGERPLYLPAGPTRGMVPQRDLEAVQRGEGAGAQTRLQATRERYSGAFVLSLASIAERIKEVTDQQYRNLAVELIIQDPEMASTVEKVLGDDTLAQLQMDAEQAVAVQNIDRTSPEFKTAVNAELGVRISDALERLGYEVVSPQRFDTETGGHAPLGTLSQTIRPDQIAMNSPVMRKNLAQRLFTQFEPAGTRNVPVLIQRSLDRIGNVTARWKSVVLPLSLRWQIGDAVGIVLFAWTRGDINPIQLVKRIREVIGRMTDPNDPRLASILFGDVLGAGIQGGGGFVDPVIAAGFGAALGGRGLRMEDIAFALEEGRRVQADPNYKPSNAAMNFFNQFRTRAFRFNEAINSIGRSAVFIEKLDGLLKEKGRSLDEIDGPGSLGDADLQQAISDAVDATNQTLGAFSDLSPWEKQVVRQIFPFWSWIKFINKAAYELAANSPERVLLAAHLGSMMTEGEDTGMADWLRGKTPVMGYFVDLNFLNPYSDASLLSRNPFTDVLETGSSVSPAITFPLTVANELYYGATGKFLPLQASPLSRPGYLEGRPEATTRGLGDVLGGIGYKGLQTFGGPFRNILDVLPTGTIPGTDVATGPVARFGQGSLRTSGAFAEPRLGPVAGRISPLLRTFGIPAPLIEQDKAMEQAKKQAQRDRAARLRRIGERKAAGQ